MTPDNRIEEKAVEVFTALWGPDDYTDREINILAEALRHERERALEEAAVLIQDWHVPSKGGTHEMAFKIRALKGGLKHWRICTD